MASNASSAAAQPGRFLAMAPSASRMDSGDSLLGLGCSGTRNPLLVPDLLAEGAGDGRDVEAEVLGHGAYDLLRGIAGPDGYRCRAHYRSL